MDEVLVIGGGPAGSAAAWLLARLGHRVTLLTRLQRHTLAESLPPSAARILDEFGLLETVERGGFYPSRGNTVWWGTDEMRVESFPAGIHGWQVERPQLDRLLLDQAAAAGAAVEQLAVRDVGFAADRVTVTGEKGSGTEIRQAQWVLDCSGRGGVLARRGFRRPVEGQATLALYAMWHRDDWDFPDETHTVVESFHDGWAWSVPVSRRKRYVTAMIDAGSRPARDRDSLAEVYLAELGKTRQLAERLKTATMMRPPQGLSAAPYGFSRAAGPGWLLVGDAASFIDPLSSFGMKKAFASAWLAAVVVHSCLLDPAITTAALDLHDRREQEMYAQLSRAAAELFAGAGAAYGPEFWAARSATEDALPDDVSPGFLRQDPAVQAAFHSLRQAETIALVPAGDVRFALQAVVRDRRVVMEDHLQCEWRPEGIRYLRNVCIPRVVRLAADSGRVPDLYQRYVAAEGATPLPDFLGVLSVLLARRVLVGRPASRTARF